LDEDDMKRAAWLLLFAASTAFAADEDPIENPRLPRIWKVQSRTKVPAEQTAAIGKKLGVELTSLENDVVDAAGVRVLINVARCADVKQAEALWSKFVEIHGRDWTYAARRDDEVVEIVCGNRAVACKVRDVVGWTPASQGDKYEVSMDVAPLVRCDGTRWNRLFNLLAASRDPTSKPAPIEEESKAFKFGDRLVLPVGVGSELTPAPKSSAPRGDVVAHEVAPPREQGVPRVRVHGYPIGGSFRPMPVPQDVSTWTSATDAWPTRAPAVQKALAAALGEKPRSGAEATARRRVEDVLDWIHSNVRYGGDEVGSRYGVEKTLAQGFGHCWDQSDVFVTLCRAAGIPARQVGGWLKGGEGHVWAEVVVEDGLLSVDPGTTWVGVSVDYLRLWISDDGFIPFVYWGPPNIKGPYICIR
jgi:hypothetical protein